MCLKTVYINTYADNAQDVTEKVIPCTPGYMCPNPRVEERYRRIPLTKSQFHANSFSSLTAPYYAPDRNLRPPTPVSPPGSRGSDGERRLSRSNMYVSGMRVVDVSQPDRSPRRRERRVPVVPEPSTRPIPIKRASTMPYGMETPPERGRRPIIIEQFAPRHVSSAVPVGPVEIVEHASSRLQRRFSRRDSDFLTPYREHSRSPQGYGSAEDEQERRQRRHRRRDARVQAAVMPASVPTFGNTDIYGTSPASSYGSSSAGSAFPPPPQAFLEPSAAVAAVKKELRWEDQVRARQNARISQRPKLSRSATGVQGEVKSILKNSPSSSPAAAATHDDELAELYRSVEGMNLQEREASTQRRSREAEEKDSADYIDRLRNRFSMPQRRFTIGTGAKRRSEIWYPEEGRYKYKG